MPTFAFNVILSSVIISLATWLSKKNPQLGGFIVALPISTMLVLAFSHAEFQDEAASVKLARSISAAIPMSLLFLVPFLFGERFGWSFWTQYLFGTTLLGVGYFVHRFVVQYF